MKFTQKKILTLITCLSLLGIFFTSCSEKDPISNIDEELPRIQASEDCEEPVEGITDFNILTGPAYEPWDVVVEVYFVSPPLPSGDCECLEYEFCAYLGFPQFIGPGYEIGIRSSSAPPTTAPTMLVSNGSNGYHGQTPVPIPGSPHIDMTNLIDGVPAPMWHQVCELSPTDDPFLIFINYPGDMAEADWPEVPVQATSGICIVGIVGNGNGGDGGGQ